MRDVPLIDLDDVVWLRRHALAGGMTDRQIADAVRSGEWHRVRRGAYCSGELWARLSSTDRHRVLCRAVLLTAHPSTVLSHVSAAIEHGAPVWGIPLDVVHTTRTDGRCGRREAGIVHHRGVLPPEQVVVRNGVPVTSEERCVVEVCVVADTERALVTANGMLHSGRTTVDEVRALAHDTRFWPESLNTHLVLRLMHPDIESVGETRLSFHFWRQRLPRPTPQVEVLDERGRVVARVDFALVEHGIFFEFDGREKYERFRREGESLEDYLMREKKREELVCLLTGWVCIRVTWEDLNRPEQLARRIRAVIASRTSAG